MKALEDILELRLFFFGTEEQKKFVYFEFIIPYFSKMGIPFYAERDWAGGPNYRIIMETQMIEVAEVKHEFMAFCNQNVGEIGKEIIQRNLQAYKKNTSTIAQMERRQYREINADNHLKLECHPIDEKYVKERFNSFQHFNVHTQSLFLMQQFINSKLLFLKEMGSEEKIKNTAMFFYDALSLSKYDEKFSILVYISNIEGVLAIAEKMQKKELFLKTYEKMYKALQPKKFFEDNGYELIYGKNWRNTLSEIYRLITANLDKLNVQDKGYYSFEEQKQLLYKNIQDIDSNFHNQLVNNNIEELLKHEEHAVFKVLINVIYKFVHMLGVNFNEKNAACYIVCQYVLDKNNTTWQEILKERGESFVF
ncbi:hypothetical protein QUF44_13055 [Bacillus subtilis]|nr:hypothetical protein [Bacillus subtilis]MDM5302504.1 hypothetical protein [Bacillus subtilis]MDM5324557.1 hypothetical protein [Bacillus subtilis]